MNYHFVMKHSNKFAGSKFPVSSAAKRKKKTEQNNINEQKESDRAKKKKQFINTFRHHPSNT